MSLSLAEYAESLAERNLIWPTVPPPTPVKATASIKPLPGIRAILWDVYGTLLRTPENAFTHNPKQEIRLQVALEKTIHEFNMWNSMYRKPGPPWKSMIHQYLDYSQQLTMAAPKRSGDFTEINLVIVWGQIIQRLFDKEYSYETQTMGDLAAYAEKVAWFFHSNLQAIGPREGCLESISILAELGIRQNLLGDAQSFSFVQLTRALIDDGLREPPGRFFPQEDHALSSRLGVKMPSRTLPEYARQQLRTHGIEPEEVLYVSSRLASCLVPAKNAGFRTALLAAERSGLEAPSQLIKDPSTKPDRLLTDLRQITSVVPGRP